MTEWTTRSTLHQSRDRLGAHRHVQIHPDDPIGRRLTRMRATWVRPPPSDRGRGSTDERAFAPDVMDLAEIKRRRAEASEADPGELLWHAQWQKSRKPRSIPRSVSRDGTRRSRPGPASGTPWAGPRVQGRSTHGLLRAGDRELYGLRGFVVEVVRENPDFDVMLTCSRTDGSIKVASRSSRTSPDPSTERSGTSRTRASRSRP